MNSFIETLNLWGGKFSGFAWPMLWQSSLLMAALLAFDLLSRRRIRASIRYALWLVVLVKLCLPPTLALPTGAAWWLFPCKAAGYTSPVTKFVVTYDTTTPTDSIQPSVPVPALPPPKLKAAGWALPGSGFVSLALLLWLAVRWRQISQKVGRATASVNLARILDETRDQAGLRSSLRLKLVDGRMSPAVCGLFRPTILLPRVLVEQLSASQLRAVLLHEAFHLRRKDVWVNCAQALLQIAYWWHPLFWLANARIRRVREEAVDDAVMLTLSGDAESYAPTLLAVAKIAFSRPLMSLGLVGIMESRSALRKRIERLVNFTAPRKAGLTILSLGGILLFSAVALPMGQAPASAPDSLSTADASEETTMTVKVDPGTFIRNVEARTDWTIQTDTNVYAETLLDILQGEGVDCHPPHHIAFNTKAGEVTMHNTPEQLEVFRRVIEQLNRADGKPELPLRDSPFHRQNILIEARFFQMPSADFENLVSDLHAYNGYRGGAPWWSVAPDKFDEFNGRITSLNLKPFMRPRIQTGHGMAAQMYIGTPPNGTELDCRPMVIPGSIDLAFRTKITGDPTGKDQTLVGMDRYQIHGTASAENYGGIVLRAENPDDSPTNLVLVLSLHIVTNVSTAHFQERLQAIIGPQNGAVTTSSSGQAQSGAGEAATAGTPPGFVERSQVTVPDDATSAGDLVRDGKLLYEMGKLDEAETKLVAALALDPGNAAARYYMNLVQAAKSGQRTGIIQTQAGRKEIVDKLNRIRFDQVIYDELPLSEVIRQLSEQTRLRDPEKKGINFLINPNPDNPANINPATGLPEAVTPPAATATPLDQLVITLNLTNVNMVDLLDKIVTVADHPIKYSIADSGVVFSRKGQLSTALLTRTFRIDPETFFAGVRWQTHFTGTNSQGGMDAFKRLISDAGVDLQQPNKSVFYNDRLHLIFVRATEKDLDAIESVIARLNTTPAQIHIKARFMEVPREFWMGLEKYFVLTNTADGKTVSVLTDPNARVAMRSLEASRGFETLAEPEVVTTSGRQTRIQAVMTKQDVVYEVVVDKPIGPITVLDTVATVLPDGYTIDLKTTATVTNVMGLAEPTNSAGQTTNRVPVQPRVRVYQASTNVRMWDGQTILLGILPAKPTLNGRGGTNPTEQDKSLVVFITVTLVDPAGNRVHSDDEMPFAQSGPPPQPH